MAAILLVEDEPGIRLAIRGLLGRDGYEIQVANDAEEAIHAIGAQAFDLVLTDFSLPNGGTGIDVALCSREHQPDTPVVLITAFGSDQVAQQATDAGVFDYVPKPFNNDDVRRVVRRALGRGT